MYILIVAAWIQTGGAFLGGYHITYQEFSTEARCKDAAAILVKPNFITTMCVPK